METMLLAHHGKREELKLKCASARKFLLKKLKLTDVEQSDNNFQCLKQNKLTILFEINIWENRKRRFLFSIKILNWCWMGDLNVLYWMGYWMNVLYWMGEQIMYWMGDFSEKFSVYH